MKNFYCLLFVLLSLHVLSQDQHCGTDIVMKRIYDGNPALKLKKQQMDEAQGNQAQRPASNPPFVVPIVFHILHVGGPENISDAQVKDAVRILNRDYGRRNPDTVDIIHDFKNIADSAGIRFVLATKDPLGNCTNGIIHHYDPDTDWDDISPTLYSHTWDPTKYLNVYIVRTITLAGGFGAAGYTYFPGTWQSGDSRDAIVVLNNYFGSTGTGANFLSRVLTHEAGHWFNLYHVFGSTNNAGVDCTGDDFINDTPPTVGYLNCPNVASPAQYQVCMPGISENFQNYMDYSYCCRMFTHDQASRMQTALQSTVSGRGNLWTNANLVATGVINPIATCLPIADFKYNRSKACTGVPVTFTDATWNGQPTAYNWSFPGGSPATSTASAPVVTYTAPGLYSVTYSSSNSTGSSSPLTKSNIITITNNTAIYNTAWSEGFESLPVLNADWTLESSSGGSKWEQSSDAHYTGNFSAKLAAPNNTRKNITAMISPAVNLAAIAQNYLSFKVAAAEITPNHINTLKVYASVDCGNTWYVMYNKSGAALITSNNNFPGFVPANEYEWRTEIINLQPVVAAAYINFKFEYTRDTIPAANNIFIDDINITNATAIQKNRAEVLQSLSVFPVPAKENLSISVTVFSAQQVKFVISDIFGRVLETLGEAELNAGKNTQTFKLRQVLAPGIYFLEAKIGETSYIRKIMIGE